MSAAVTVSTFPRYEVELIVENSAVTIFASRSEDECHTRAKEAHEWSGYSAQVILQSRTGSEVIEVFL